MGKKKVVGFITAEEKGAGNVIGGIIFVILVLALVGNCMGS